MASRKRQLNIAFPEVAEDANSARASWRDGQHGDWTLRIGSRSFNVHKIIVSTGERRSLFLDAAFRKPCGETAETDLTDLLPASCHAMFEDLLDYFYGEALELAAESWGAFMKIADVMQVPALHTLCISKCDGLMEAGNPIDVYASAVACCLKEEWQFQVLRLAADILAPKFTSGRARAGQSYNEAIVQACLQGHDWAFHLLQEVLPQDDLEVCSEDEVCNTIQQVIRSESSAAARKLWRCCRLEHLSAAKLLEVAAIEDIPREMLAWAIVCKGQEIGPGAPAPSGFSFAGPRLAYARQSCQGLLVNSIRLLIKDPCTYAKGQEVYSEWRRLHGDFKFRLRVFPQGTEYTNGPEPAAFVQVVPQESRETWEIKDVKYEIIVLNHLPSKRPVSQGETFTFTHGTCPPSFDRGFHDGFLPEGTTMTRALGWLDEHDRLWIEAWCDLRK